MIIGFGISPSRVKASAGISYDADASAFFTAASITDSTQKSAVNQLVLDLKSYNIWTKCLAIYPIVGGSASSHSVNLKTPGTYNLTFTTGWTHASTGMTPVSAYANTSITTTTIGLNSGSLGFYSRTNNTFQGGDIGTFDAFSASYIYTYISGSPTNRDYRYTENAGVTRLSSPTRTDGFICVSRTSNTLVKGYRNGSIEVSNNATTATNLGTGNIYLGAFNFYGGSPFYSNRELAFGYVSTGLTDTESANFYTAVQAYQTTLSRNV